MFVKIMLCLAIQTLKHPVMETALRFQIHEIIALSFGLIGFDVIQASKFSLVVHTLLNPK